MPQKVGWIYMFSEVLNQEIAYHQKSGWVVCKDGTKYSPKEIELLASEKCEVPETVHWVKKQFEGDIIDITENATQPTEFNRSTTQGSTSNSGSVNENTSTPIHENTCNSSTNGQNYLDLF